MTNIPDANALSKFDVIKLAKSILAEVDQIRAYDTMPDDATKEGLKVPSESRLNAFYRLVGLPMLVIIENEKKEDGSEKADNEGTSATKVLSPGFFGGNLSGKNIKNADTEIEVESNNRKISTILNLREEQLSLIEAQVGTEKSSSDMTKALKNALPLAANISEKNSKKYSFVEVGSGDFKRDVFKKLLPPVTSYRVVLPVRNEVARPFVLEESDRKVDSQTILKMPFIEMVARIRLLSAGNADSSADKAKNQAFQDSIEAVAGSESIAYFTNLKAGLLEGFIINKLETAFYQLAAKWKELKKKQEILNKNTNFKISIKTSSSRASPFGKRVEADFESDSNAVRKLKDLRAKLAREEILLSLFPTNDALFKTNAKTSNTKNTSFSALINQFSTLITFNAERLRKAVKNEEEFIKKHIREFEKLRVGLDAITGEFTGLSIPDVLAVISSLFTIKIESLVGLLDTKAVKNMKKDKRLKTALESLNVSDPNLNNTINAIKDLTKAINAWFKLLNVYVKFVENRGNRRGQHMSKKNKEQRKSSGSYGGS